jgi:Mce-associated membrane protein
MPSGKKLRTTKPEEEAAEFAPADDTASVDESAREDPAEEPPAGDVPAEEAQADELPVKQSRRRNFLRRRKNQAAEPATVAEDVTEEATASADELQAEEKADDKPVEAEAPADEEPAGEAPADEADEPVDGEAAAEPILVPHQPAGKRLKIAAAAAAALFVAGGAFLGATAQPVISNRALVETKLNIARTAANAITTLWSYTPENMDSLGQRSARYLTGDFGSQYKKFIDSIVATNKQAQVTNTTTVLGTAVESVTPTDASAVVYTNSIATSPVSKNIPSLRYLSYRLEMKRDRSEWRITRMTTITTLDLTPQL